MNVAETQYLSPLLTMTNPGMDALREKGANKTDFADVLKEQATARQPTESRDSSASRPARAETANGDDKTTRDKRSDGAEASVDQRAEPEEAQAAKESAPVKQQASADTDEKPQDEVVDGSCLPQSGSELPQALPGTALLENVGTAAVNKAQPVLADTPSESTGAAANPSESPGVVGLALGIAQHIAQVVAEESAEDPSGAMKTPSAIIPTVSPQLLKTGMDDLSVETSTLSGSTLMDGDGMVLGMGQGPVSQEAGRKGDFASLVSEMRSMVDGVGSTRAPATLTATRTGALTPANPELAARLALFDPDMAGKLAEKVSWVMSQNLSSARIDIDPLDLGPVQINIMSQDDHLKVSFVAQHSAARDAIDQGAARLKEILQQQGHASVDVNVSQGSAQQREERDRQAGSSPNRHSSEANEGDGVDVQTLTTRIAVARSLVDQFV